MLAKFIDIEGLIHSFKTLIACLLGLLATRIIGLPAEQWVIISILVVMCAQIYVGSVLQKAYLRFLGTLLGCLIAAVVLATLGANTFIIAATIGLSSFVFSYLATSQENMSYAGTLGAVTTAIIMLGQQPTVIFALERFLEISLGILIASLVSQFILPIHARSHLRRSQALTLKQLRDYYTAAMINQTSETAPTDYHELDETIVKTLLKQRQLAKESAPERFGEAFDTNYFMQTLYSEREILRAVTFMHIALTHIDNLAAIFNKLPHASLFNQEICTALETLIASLESAKPIHTPLTIPHLNGLKEEILQNIPSPTPDELIYIDGFLFSAGRLIDSLEDLASLYRVPLFEEPVTEANT